MQTIITMQDGAESNTERFVTTVEALETTFKKRAVSGATAILEASTNSFSIASRLNDIGIDAHVVTSDCLAGKGRKDKINDAIDSRNLARAFISGDVQLVWQPSPKHRGMRDLKTLMVQAAQAGMRTGNGNMHKWAKHLCAKGKTYNLATCALARKMVIYVWHILMGHPTPNAKPDPTFVRKLSKLASEVGKETLKKLGYNSAKEYVEAVSNTVYANCNKQEELQTGPLASA